MIRKMCNEPGCTRPCEGRYCEEHRAAAERRKAARQFAGASRKDSAAWARLYGTARWRAMRLAFLAEHPCCAMCGAPASVVDHVEPHRGDEALFYSEENLQSLCQSCHSAKTLAEN